MDGASVSPTSTQDRVQADRWLPQSRVERVSQALVTVAIRDADAGFAAVRQPILRWLQQQAGVALPGSMLRGEAGSLDLLGAQRVETVSLQAPRVWAARQDHWDDEVARRTWVTEATLAVANRRELLLGFRLHCVTMGDAPPVDRSVPQFMRDVVAAHTVELDGTEIDLDAQMVDSDDDVDGLVRLLADPRRQAPVVGLSMGETRDGDRELVDADRLAATLFGTAHVRLLSRRASYALSDAVGRALSVYNGALRTWWPGLRPGHADPYDHPLLLAERIWEEGEEAVRRLVAERVLRASAGQRGADTLIVPFADLRRAASGSAREVAAARGSTAAEILPMYEEETRRLETELREKAALHDGLLEAAQAEIQVREQERDEARAEIHVLRARLAAMEQAVRAREPAAAVHLPDTFDELAAWAAVHVADTVKLLPRAIHAAKKSEFEDRRLAYQALLLLHETYVPMRRTGAAAVKERWESGLRQLGLECSATHAGSRAGENAKDYTVDHGGKRRWIDMHLKGSNSRDPRYCFRLYFFWDEDRAQAVVASLPTHLPTRAT